MPPVIGFDIAIVMHRWDIDFRRGRKQKIEIKIIGLS
jgi:hypothetical protein